MFSVLDLPTVFEEAREEEQENWLRSSTLFQNGYLRGARNSTSKCGLTSIEDAPSWTSTSGNHQHVPDLTSAIPPNIDPIHDSGFCFADVEPVEPPLKKQRGQFHCNVCDMPFTEKRALQRHERQSRKHLDALDMKAPQPYDCDECGHSFVRHHDLQRHRDELHGSKRRAELRSAEYVDSNASYWETESGQVTTEQIEPTRRDKPQIETLKNFRVGIDSPCREVLPLVYV